MVWQKSVKHLPHILGAGSLGLLWCAAWHANNQRCTLITRDHQRARSLSQDGFTLSDGDTEKHISCHALSADQLTANSIDFLVVACKAHDTENAIKSVRPALCKHAIILTLQNGLGTQEVIANYVDSTCEIWAATTTDGANRPRSNQLIRAGSGLTRYGVWRPRDIEHDISSQLPNQLVILEFSNDIKPWLWQKLAINAVINPLTALHDCKNGNLLIDANLQIAVANTCREVSAILSAEGLITIADNLLGTVNRVAHSTADNISSMLSDVRQKRATEVDFILGYLLTCAKLKNIETPQLSALYEGIKNLNLESN